MKRLLTFWYGEICDVVTLIIARFRKFPYHCSVRLSRSEVYYLARRVRVERDGVYFEGVIRALSREPQGEELRSYMLRELGERHEPFYNLDCSTAVGFSVPE